MNLELEEQVTVVIGSAMGIGRAIAETFHGEGARLMLVDRSPSVAETAAALGASYRVADVVDYGAMQRVAAETEAELGPVRHVLFTVGIESGKAGFPFWNLEPSDWPKVYAVNVQGMVNVAHAFVQPMAERRQGTFLFFTSIAGQIGSQTDPPYSASKAAMINFGQCMAKDLAPYNVRVNLIAPGLVSTPLQHKVYAMNVESLPEEQRPTYDEWAAEKIGRLIPLNRWQTPEDMANMAVFLASERAANITGQTLNVNGGWIMYS